MNRPLLYCSVALAVALTAASLGYLWLDQMAMATMAFVGLCIVFALDCIGLWALADNADGWQAPYHGEGDVPRLRLMRQSGVNRQGWHILRSSLDGVICWTEDEATAYWLAACIEQASPAEALALDAPRLSSDVAIFRVYQRG